MILLVVGVLIALALAIGALVIATRGVPASAKPTAPQTLALYEYAHNITPMEPGWNIRKFNAYVSNGGLDFIDVDDGAGIELPAGTYRIQALSIVTSPDEVDLPGYASIFSVNPTYEPFGSSTGMLATGSIANAKYNLPSILDIEIELKEATNLYLAHQLGDLHQCVGVDKCAYLTMAGNPSSNHIFAQMFIEKM
jgi:hypothetical protein